MSPHLQSGSLHSEASEWDELEARSLVFAEIDGPQERLTTKRNVGNSFRWKQILVMIILSICAYMVYIKEDVLTLLMMDVEKEHEIKIKDRVGDLKRKVMERKMEFEESLEQDYGIYKDEIFSKDDVMTYFESPTQSSVERLRRRILIRILEAQLGTTGKRVDFNYVVAGHSAAAGHGNLFNQTYGYVLEQSVGPIFEAMGITFFGKNYAMGGMKSAPESALCMTSIYGPEIDILSWDFGMTDGSRDGHLFNIWAQRAGAHPTRPIIISYGSVAARPIHANVENAGMGAFDAVSELYKHPNNPRYKLPDSLSDDVNVDDLPRALKLFRCGDQFEAGEPCGDNKVKYDTQDYCNVIKGQVSWHNGWKDHLLKGKIISAYLIANILEVIDTLENGQYIDNKVDGEENGEESDNEEKEVDNEKEGEQEIENHVTPGLSQAYLDHLYELEARDKALFFESEVPSVHYLQGDLKSFDEMYLRAKNICRYSYTPSFSRYKGLVTEAPQKLEYLGGGKYTYVVEGEHFKSRPPPTPQNDTKIHLVYDLEGDHQNCPYADIDFKDYFNVRWDDQWTTTIVPNESENETFNNNGEDWTQRLGLVTICERVFAWNRFPSNYMSIEDMFNSTITNDEDTIIVNDVKVSGVTKFGTNNAYCFALHHDGEYVFPPSEEHGLGRYELRFKMPTRGKQLYVSSIIVM